MKTPNPTQSQVQIRPARLFVSLGVAGMALMSACLFAPTAAKASIVGPYTADANTLYLFHFDGAAGTSVITNNGSVALNAYAVSNAAPGGTVTTPSPANTGILGAAAYAGFGNAAGFLAISNLIGFDANNSGTYQPDVSTNTLSPDAILMSSLNIGNSGQTPFTLEAMIAPTTITAAAAQEIISADNSSGTVSARGFQFRINTVGQLEFNEIAQGVDLVATIPLTGIHAFQPNNWYHVAVTYDGTTVRLYWTKVDPSISQDNLLLASAAVINATAGASSCALTIGNENRNISGEQFQGSIDEVRISKVARSATQMLFGGPLTWVGDGSANLWTLGTVSNWNNGASAVVFNSNNSVVFDDTSANTNVNLTGVLLPDSVTFSNSTKNYTLGSTGSIGGSAYLNKFGTGTLTLSNNNNTYSGATTISAGKVNEAAPSVGAASVATPLLYLSFDRASGNATGATVINEGSGGTAMNGVVVGSASITSGGRLGGNALSIGSGAANSGYVLINNPVVAMTGAGSWSIGMWLKTSTAGGAYAYQGSGGWGSGNMEFYLNPGSASAGTHAGGVSFAQGWEQGSTNINDGAWHFVVMTCNGTTKAMYVDGNVDTIQTSWLAGTGVGSQLWIGGGPDATSGQVGLNGLIDEVSVYNRALSQSEVQTLMTAGTTQGAVSPNSAVSVAASSTLDLVGNSQVVAGLSGAGTVDSTLANGAPMLVVNNNPAASANIFSGVITNSAGSLSLAKTGAGTLTLNGATANGYSGSTILSGGSLIEDFANATSANNLISTNSTLVLGGVSTFQVKQKSATTTSQTFSNTIINPGFSKVIGTQVTSGALSLSLGLMSQNPGGVVDFTTPTGGSITVSNAAVNNILGGWATVNGTVDWATTNASGNIITYAGYTSVSGTNAPNATLNWKNTANAAPSASGTINSANVVGGDLQVGTTTLTLASGGLILGSTERWVTTGTGGTLKSGLSTGEFYIHANTLARLNGFQIQPNIADGSVPTTVIKDGPGQVQLAARNTYTGGTVVNAGTMYLGTSAGSGTGTIRNTLTINSGATVQMLWADCLGYTAGSAVTAINIYGGTLNNSSNSNNGYLATLNLAGGTLSSTGGGAFNSTVGINSLASPITSTISAPFAMRAAGLTINVAQGTTPSGIDLVDSGIISYGSGGSGAVTKTGAGTLLLSGANSFTGGVNNNAGTIVIGNNAAFGTAAGTLTMNGGSVVNNPGNSYTNSNNISLASAGSFGVNTGDTLSLQGAISNTNSLTKNGGGILKFTSANTFSGNTTINAGTLALSGVGSIANSPNITIASGAALDVSATSTAFNFGASQTLFSSGSVVGSATVTNGSKLYAGTDGTYATGTFANNLTLAPGAAVYFDLSTSASGVNDKFTVAGNLTNNFNLIHIKAPSTSVGLDQSADYVLFSVAGIIASNVAFAPVWDVTPTNSTHFRIVTAANTVSLHYDASLTAPAAVGVATTPVTRNQNVNVSVAVTVGTYAISTVIADTSAVGGSSTLTLFPDATGTNYTNTVNVSTTTPVGSKTFSATVTDSNGFFTVATIPLTVTVANQTWNGGGADDNWTSNPNWLSGAGPALAGDSVSFAGATRLFPNLNANFSVTGVTFNSGASSFTNSSASGNFLTLTGSGVTNNSANPQTLNVPIAMAAAQTFNAASGNLIFSQAVTNGGNLLTVSGTSNAIISGAIVGAGALTKTGNGTLTLSGVNAYTGATAVNAGSVNFSGSLGVAPATAASALTVNNNGGNAIVTVSSPANIRFNNNNPLIGNNATAVGALFQTGGIITGMNQLQLGAVTGGSYGYYNLSGGTNTVTEFDIGGFNGAAVGVCDMSGGTLNVTNWFIPSRGVGGTGIFNMTGGTLNFSGPAAQIAANWGGGTVGVGIIGIANGNFIALPANVNLMQTGGSGKLGEINLLTGGLMQVNSVAPGSATGNSLVNFNGGTLKASTATTNFLTANLTTVNVFANGGTINNNGVNITLPKILSAPTGSGIYSAPVTAGGSGYVTPPAVTFTGDGVGAAGYATVSGGAITGIVITSPGTGYSTITAVLTGGGGSGATIDTSTLTANTSGGMTFNGSGTTTLANGNTYTGTTLVAGGKLNWNYQTMGVAGDMIVSNATLVLDATGGSAYTPANLTLSSNGVVTFAYGTLANVNPGFTAIAATGNLTSLGTNIINMTGSGFVLGQFPLISYNGTPLTDQNFTNDFKIGTLPPGVSGYLSNNATATPPSVDLVVTLIGQTLTWNGNTAGSETNWDINTTPNWTGGDNYYHEYSGNTFGDIVTFDDSLTYPYYTNVNLTTTLHPSTLTVSGTYPYSLTGSGSIAGAGALVMSNSASLFLGTSNSYTGGTTINAGTVIVTNDNGLGASSGALTLNSGTMQYAASTASTRAMAVNANSTVDVVAGATVQLGGVLSGTSTLTKTDNGTLSLTNVNTYNAVTTVAGGTLAVANGLFGNTAYNIEIAPASGQVASFNVSNGVVNANRVIIAGISANNSTPGTGTVNQSGGTINSLQWFTVGSGGTSGGVGTYNMSGGVLNVENQQMEVGNFVGAAGTVNMSGSSAINIWNNNFIALGANNNATSGTFVQNGGTVTFYSDAGTTTASGTGILYLGKATTSTGVFTYNLNGGTLTANQISRGGGTGNFYFNGGTLKAAKATTTFMTGLSAALVSTNGATIDDGGFAITIGQALTHDSTLGAAADSGLTKNGSGSLTLTGVNTFTGPITNNGGTLTLNSASTYAGAATINAGSLVMTTASQIGGNVTFNNGTSLSLTQVGTATNLVGNLNLGSASGTGATLNLALANGNASPTLLNCGTLTLTGTNYITLAGGFSVGVVPLIHYTGAIAGSGSFNSTIVAPRGVTAVLSNSVSTSTIYAVITSTGSGIVWTGTSPINPNLWDITTSTNWTILGAPTAYLQPVTPGDAVTFNDSGSSSVTLNTTVSPANMTISNAFSSYTFSGSGHIAGTTSLLKQGAGSVTLNIAASTYTGNTTVSAGTLKMGAANMIPGGAGNGNVTNNGTIDLNTFSDTMNGLSGSGIIDTVAGGTPTLTVNSSNTNNTTFSGAIKNTAGTLSLVKTGTNTLTLSGANTFSGNLFANAGTIIITNGGSANNIGTWVSIGQTTNDNATLTLSGTGSLATTFDFNVGDIGNAIGTVNVKDSASLTMANFFVASANNAGSTASGTVNQTGGTVMQTSTVVGTFAIGGRTSASGSGVYNLSGGTLTAAAGIRVGGTGTGTFNQNGGQVNAMGGVNIARIAGSTGTYYLNAGTLTTINVTSSTGINANLYLNGGLLQATNPANPFMSNLTAATVMVGGAKIDSGTNSIVISQPLLDGGTGGGLTKYGTGTLYMNGANTYTGNTMVTNGTLAGIGSIAGSAVIAPAGNLGAGNAGATVGSLTISGNLTLQGGATLRINKTGGSLANDQVVVSGNTTYGGTLSVTNITSDATALVAGDSFQLFSTSGSISGAFAVTNLPTLPTGLAWSNSINGSITVIATVNTTPTNITTSVSGNVLTLTWPADHTGWRLIVQTNNLAAGISSDPTDWMTVPGSQSVNTTNITMDPALPTEFYQLVYP